MKILEIKTFLLKVPLGTKGFYSSQCAFPQRNSLLVQIITDNGLIGWGECGQYGPGEPVATFVKMVLTPMIIGKNPLDIVILWEEMFSGIRDFGRKTTGVEAMSGLDIALWDIAGKYYKKPIYELLGGAFRKKIRGYATGCYYRGGDVLNYKGSMSELQDEAKRYIDSGFSAMKAKIGLLHVEQDAERVDSIRRVVGKDIVLMVDANHAYNLHSAKKMGKLLEGLGVHFFEEPLLPEDLFGYASLRQSLNMAIAAGENEFTRFGFNELIKNNCLDIVQPDIACAGGFTETKRIEILANTNHVQMIPHCWGSGIALAATLHLCSTIAPLPHTAFPIAPENEPMVEYDQNFNPLRDELLATAFHVNDGFVEVPQGHGLGIEVKIEILEKYAV